MKKINALAVGLLLMAFASALAFAAEENKPQTSMDQQMKQPATESGSMERPSMAPGGQGRVVLGEVVPLEGKITQIDKTNRTLTLQGPEGHTVTLKADSKATHFNELKVGDTIKAQFFQGLIIGVGEQNVSEPSLETVTVQSPAGQTPSELRMATITMQAKVEAVDADKHTVTLTGPEGKSETFKVNKDVNFDQLKPGSTLTVRYLLGVALELEKQ